MALGGCYLGDELSAHGIIQIPFPGYLVDETSYDGIEPQTNIKITKIGLMVADAPTGANVTVDLLKDGSEQSRTATLTDGSTYETTDITDITYATTERLGAKIKSVGSTKPGAGLVINCYYEVI